MRITRGAVPYQKSACISAIRHARTEATAHRAQVCIRHVAIAIRWIGPCGCLLLLCWWWMPTKAHPLSTLSPLRILLLLPLSFAHRFQASRCLWIRVFITVITIECLAVHFYPWTMRSKHARNLILEI